MIPLLILDTTDRPDLEELVRVHEHLPPGDVDCQWGQVYEPPGKVALILSFKAPVKTTAILVFDIVQDGILVDQILHTKILYLQAGRKGDRFITTPNASRIFAEIPDTGFAKYWNDLFHKGLTRHFKGQGLARRAAKNAAKVAIKEMRDFGRVRMIE